MDKCLLVSEKYETVKRDFTDIADLDCKTVFEQN